MWDKQRQHIADALSRDLLAQGFEGKIDALRLAGVAARAVNEARVMIRQQTWLPRDIERLRTLWADGKTANEIARELGEDRFSRNAVIGKAHRLGLPARPSPIERGPSQ